MVRWEPGTADRLRAAAIELYLDPGYEATSVQQIAERAGVSERTYFRHYADKREVLFDAGDRLGHAFVEAIASAPSARPLDLIEAGLAASATVFPRERLPWARARQIVIEANTALREREMLKLANLAATITSALRDRGLAEPTASMTAQSAMAIFQVGFANWVDDQDDRDMSSIHRELLDEWRALTKP